MKKVAVITCQGRKFDNLVSPDVLINKSGSGSPPVLRCEANTSSFTSEGVIVPSLTLLAICLHAEVISERPP